MSASQQYEYFDRDNESVMARTAEGIINFWNRSAEALYGWKREEAIGKVSHDLLQTQFPKPLEEIESELIRNGRWEGKLVHTTRNGRRVTVQSRWTVDPGTQPRMVVEMNAQSGNDENVKKPRSKAEMFANASLAAALCACAAVFLYYLYYYNISGQRYFVSHIGIILYQVVPFSAALLLLGAFRLAPAHRINLALVLFSMGVSVYGAELGLTFSESVSSSTRTLWGDAHFDKSVQKEIHALARRFNTGFDTRSRLEVIKALRRRGIPAVPSIAPIALLNEHSDGRFGSKISLGGEEILPLGGISNRVAVLCNETGQYSIYDSDERGFHNPRGLWGSRNIAIAAVGDSFTEGACVPSDRNFMALIRDRYPETLNLGMSGEGPLFMLAATAEYLRFVKPKTVLWFFYEENDFNDLLQESKTPLLRKYLEGNFRQGLVDRQGEIDKALNQYVEQEMKRESAKTSEEEKGDESESRWRYFRVPLEFLKLSRLRADLGLIYGQAAQYSEDPYSQAQFDLFRSVLLEAKRSVNEWGGTLYFVYLPARDRYAHGQDYHRQAVLDLVNHTGIPIIDIHARFQREKDPVKLFPFGRFGHYNEGGYRLVAEEVLRSIQVKNAQRALTLN